MGKRPSILAKKVSKVAEVEGQLAIAEEIVALAVVGGDAVLADGIAVFLRGIALVGEPVVLGIFLCQAVHVVVAIGLGEDAGCGDREVFAIALHDRRMRYSLTSHL